MQQLATAEAQRPVLSQIDHVISALQSPLEAGIEFLFDHPEHRHRPPVITLQHLLKSPEEYTTEQTVQTLESGLKLRYSISAHLDIKHSLSN